MMRRDRHRLTLRARWLRWRADREERRLRALLEQLSRERKEDGRG